MEQIRGLIFAVCMCAVLNAGVRLLSPDKLQKEMRIICTLMLIICMAAALSSLMPFSGGFTIDVGELISKENSRQNDYADSVLAETERALADELTEKLSELGIDNAEVGIVCAIDEYNYVRAERVTIHLHGGEDGCDGCDENERRTALEAAEAVVSELFPDAETEVKTDDESADRAVLGQGQTP